MSEPSKKLTVSFGAFSCTLAGFDDPFPIMKQVVDYFQQLAARDPHFGAHPERPSTDALRTIAQDLSGTEVEAEMCGDEVVLTQSAPEIIEEETSAVDAPLSSASDMGMETEQNACAEIVEPTAAPKLTAAVETSTVEDNTKWTIEDVTECPVVVEEEPARTAPAPDQVALAVQNWSQPEPPVASAEAMERDQDMAAMQAAVAAHTTQIIAEMEAPAPLTLDLPNFEDAPESATEDMSIEYAPEPAAVPETATVDHTQMEAYGDFDVVEDDIIDPNAADLADWEAEFAPHDDIQSAVPMDMAPSEPLDEELEMEDAALERILASLRSRSATADSSAKPAYQTKPAELPTQAEAPDLPPLKLGFGMDEGLDATHEAETEFVDHRQRDESRAFDAILGPQVNDEAEFDYAAAPEAAPEPLMLTPALKVENPISNADGQLRDDAQPADLRQFASAVGAASITDLIEASAAYVTLVDGRPNFSRREVLGMLDTLTDDQNLTQETRIRSFGTLLRGGRFKRAMNGEFALCDDALHQYDSQRSA